MSKGSYLKSWRRVLAEGFRLQELLTLCIRENIRLRKVRQKSDLAMEFEITEEDWQDLGRFVGSRWRFTTLERKGAAPFALRILARKSLLLGAALFLFLVCYQSMFIHEIRIEGFQRLTETEIREALADAGLYEGCRKTLNPDQVEIQMYEVLDHIAYCGIKYDGCLAEVYISERDIMPEKLDISQYAHVVAKKAGYIEKVTATGGSPAVSADQHVDMGDVLITGAYRVQDTTFESTGEGRQVYTHAMGEVLAKVPYRLTFYQDRYDLKESFTGRQAPGFSLTFGSHSFRTDSLFRPYDAAIVSEKPVISLSRPFPLKIAAVFSREISPELVLRSDADMEQVAEAQLREWCRKNLPENAEIRNKDLKFVPKNNIIEVTIMLETLEDIGREQTFVPARIEPVAESKELPQ